MRHESFFLSSWVPPNSDRARNLFAESAMLSAHESSFRCRKIPLKEISCQRAGHERVLENVLVVA